LADALKIHLKVLCIREIHKVGKQKQSTGTLSLVKNQVRKKKKKPAKSYIIIQKGGVKLRKASIFVVN